MRILCTTGQWLFATTVLLWMMPGVTDVRAQSRQPGSASLTEDYLARQRDLEAQIRNQLKSEETTADRFSLDVGGWVDGYILLFDDGVESSRTLRQTDFRLYGAFSADRGVHTAYARMRLSYRDWNYGDSYTGNEDDVDGPNLERGWYQFDVRKAWREYLKEDLPFDLKMKIGRDFVQVGTGYAIALPLDHVSLVGEWENFRTTFIMGKTPDSTSNIDRSRPVQNSSNRNFWIIEERYTGFDHHEPFVYWALQNDSTPEEPKDLLQNYEYDSQYVGLGSVGEITRNLRYSTEWVIERGTSYGDRRFLHKDDIRAWAFDQLFEYYFDHKTKPKMVFEYMFASGDQDRLDSPTNAAGGNRGDHVDRGFSAFGFRDTGLSFAPRLSNIHVWRVGGSFRPFPEVKKLRDLELGTDWFLYAKHRSEAAVSDPTADRQSGYLGWEMDYYANYRITSDLSWTVRFGTFFPGRAYSDQTTRTFLLSGLTWSF